RRTGARLAATRARRRRRRRARRRGVGRRVRRRVAGARNLAKAWLLFLAPVLLLGLAGWKLGGYRLALLFGGSVVLVGAALYAYADRIVMGMGGGRELLPGESPALHLMLERLSSRAGVVRPKLYLLPG